MDFTSDSNYVDGHYNRYAFQGQASYDIPLYLNRTIKRAYLLSTDCKAEWVLKVDFPPDCCLLIFCYFR